MKIKLLPAFLLLLILSSCNNKMLFTWDLKQKIDQRELDLQKVQFYNSDKITLRRILPHNEAMVSDGTIKFEDGQYVEEIVIKKETPGICEEASDFVLNVSFEPGDNKTIGFTLNKLTKNYDLYLEQSGNEKGRIVYDSLIYVVQPSKQLPKLLVEKNDVYIYKIDQRVLEGRKVN